MYCRQCHYDLRALTTNRCPECGHAFDPRNPDTFYSELPTVRSRVQSFLESGFSWRGWIVVILCLFWLFVFLLPALETRSRPAPMRREIPASINNLTSIMAVWMRQQNDSPLQQVAFDKQAVRSKLRPSLSMWTESNFFLSRLRVQNSLENYVFFAIPLATIFGTIALLWRGRIRQVVGVLAILFVLLSASSGAARFLSTLFVPGTHSFLDDYVYLENIDLRHATGRIAAYDWRRPFQGWPHVIAFDDGLVEFVDDVRARSLFEQQGLAYPEPKERDKEND